MGARKLGIRSATFNVDGQEVTINQGDEVPENILELLPAGALARVEEPQPEDPPIEPSLQPVSGDYDDHTVEELQAEANRRGLQIEGSGKDGNVLKGDLVAALQASDG